MKLKPSFLSPIDSINISKSILVSTLPECRSLPTDIVYVEDDKARIKLSFLEGNPKLNGELFITGTIMALK